MISPPPFPKLFYLSPSSENISLIISLLTDTNSISLTFTPHLPGPFPPHQPPFSYGVPERVACVRCGDKGSGAKERGNRVDCRNGKKGKQEGGEDEKGGKLGRGGGPRKTGRRTEEGWWCREGCSRSPSASEKVGRTPSNLSAAIHALRHSLKGARLGRPRSQD